MSKRFLKQFINLMSPFYSYGLANRMDGCLFCFVLFKLLFAFVKHEEHCSHRFFFVWFFFWYKKICCATHSPKKSYTFLTPFTVVTATFLCYYCMSQMRLLLWWRLLTLNCTTYHWETTRDYRFSVQTVSML